MKKHRHRILGAVLFVLYLVLLTYFLFFAEEMGRSPDARAEYSYNLTLFKEIRRFILYRDILGWRAVFLNIFGNVLAFMPFGFFLPVIWERTRHWYVTVIKSRLQRTVLWRQALRQRRFFFMPPPLAFLIIPREMRLLRQRLWVFAVLSSRCQRSFIVLSR